MSAPHDGLGQDAAERVLSDVVREHGSQLAASLVSLLGDFSAAEDLVADAVEKALRTWPVDGIPDRPQAWLFTVARRRGLDVLRRESNYRDKLLQLNWPATPEPDDRLRLMFTCCHPALSRQAQVALTLRVVCGLTTPQIAKAFLVSGGQRCRSGSCVPNARSVARESRTGCPTPTSSPGGWPRCWP